MSQDVDSVRADQLRALARALDQETAVVRELREALLQQRAGVAANDVPAVDASADAIGRIILTLQQAREHRTGLLATWIGDGSLPLDRLEELLGHPLPDPLEASRRRLRLAARDAAHDAAVNRRVLRGAVEAGEAFLQALFSSAADPAPVYRDPVRPGPPAPSSGVVVNRRA